VISDGMRTPPYLANAKINFHSISGHAAITRLIVS